MSGYGYRDERNDLVFVDYAFRFEGVEGECVITPHRLWSSAFVLITFSIVSNGFSGKIEVDLWLSELERLSREVDDLSAGNIQTCEFPSAQIPKQAHSIAGLPIGKLPYFRMNLDCGTSKPKEWSLKAVCAIPHEWDEATPPLPIDDFENHSSASMLSFATQLHGLNSVKTELHAFLRLVKSEFE